jgi:hypothetical protein
VRDSDIDNPNTKKTSEAVDESEGSEKRPSIFARIDPRAKAILEEAASGRTYADVIERLLAYYEKQDEDVREKILEGHDVNPLKESEKLLAQLSRGQHAYEEKRHYYAAKIYTDLVATLSSPGSSRDLLEFCKYRLGHCWIELAYVVRDEALRDDSQRKDGLTSGNLYEIALQALDAALDPLREISDNRRDLTSLVAHYNIACCCSLKAQYMVEAKLDSKDRDLLREGDTLKHWNTIGETWGMKYGKDTVVDGWAKDALKELENIHSVEDDSQGDLDWIVEMAKRDADLIFLRADINCEEKFNQWSIPTDDSIANPVKQLLREHRLRFAKDSK